MKQPVINLATVIAALLAGLILLAGYGCNDQSAQPDTPPANSGIASTSPAATDLLRHLRDLGLQAGRDDAWDPLVGVSDFDVAQDGQPKVGGYLNFDWETLAQLRPATLIVQVTPDKLPAEAKARADDLGIELLHLQIDRLPDVADAVENLVTAAGAQDPSWYIEQFQSQLAQSRRDEPGLQRVPTLILLNGDLTFVAGRGNYLDDLLADRGGVNALGDTYSSWPNVDDEVLTSLRPSAVVLLLPAASEAEIATARQRFEKVAGDWPVSWEQVVLLDDAYAMTPGAAVIEVGEAIAEATRAAER